jgi:hypothetical protein
VGGSHSTLASPKVLTSIMTWKASTSPRGLWATQGLGLHPLLLAPFLKRMQEWLEPVNPTAHRDEPNGALQTGEEPRGRALVSALKPLRAILSLSH